MITEEEHKEIYKHARLVIDIFREAESKITILTLTTLTVSLCKTLDMKEEDLINHLRMIWNMEDKVGKK